MSSTSEFWDNEIVETEFGRGTIMGHDEETNKYLICFSKKNANPEYAKGMLGLTKLEMIDREKILTKPREE